MTKDLFIYLCMVVFGSSFFITAMEEKRGCITQEALEHATTKIKKKLDLNDKQLYFSLSENGYFEAFGSLFQGVRYADNIDSIVHDLNRIREHNAFEEYEQALRVTCNVVENNYKLHGMPFSSRELKKAIRLLCCTLKRNQSFGESLYRFSIMPNVDFDSPDLAGFLAQEGLNPGIMPIIKIYPASQRESAQTALDICYNLFNNMQGLEGIVPRYNKPLTHFLSYAQDDGDIKLLRPGYFQEDLVHLDDNFRHTLLPEFFQKVETTDCYHLEDPR